MRILTDPKEYVDLQAWARKTVESMGIAKAQKLKTAVDKAMQGGAVNSDIEKLEGMSFSLLQAVSERRLKAFMSPGIEAIKHVKKHSQEQRQKRDKRQTWKGMTREQIGERNQRIIEHFKTTHLAVNHFSDKYAAKYGIKPRTVRLILSKAVGSLPG